MDIYEFTQVLIRRKRLLLVGFATLFAFVVLMAFDPTNGFAPRSSPKYQATVSMAVVPDDFDVLTQDLGSATLAGPATIFSSLLASPQAALEIEEQEGVTLLGLDVGATGRDRFFTASALAGSPEEATAAALGAFEWLEQRLAQPLLTASVPTATAPPAPLLDEEGRLRGVVRLEFDHALAINGEGLWVVTTTVPGDGFAYRLIDAGVEPIAEYETLIEPGGNLAVGLEDAVGNLLDEIDVELPELPAQQASSYRLVVLIDRGAVRGIVDAPRLDADRIGVSWEAIGGPLAETTVDEVSVVLLTDVPVPVSIGGRRGPLMIVGLMTVGTIALLVLAVAVDNWNRERARRQAGTAPGDGRTAVSAISSDGEASDGGGSARSERVASARDSVAVEGRDATTVVQAVPLQGAEESDGGGSEDPERVAPSDDLAVAEEGDADVGGGAIPLKGAGDSDGEDSVESERVAPSANEGAIDERFKTLKRRLSS